jgi:hypothetical protein
LNGPFVLDASLTMTWVFTNEATRFTARVLESLKTTHAVTPALWAFEVTNALLNAERRGRINAAQQADFLEQLRLLPIHIEHRPAAWLGQQIGVVSPNPGSFYKAFDIGLLIRYPDLNLARIP